MAQRQQAAQRGASRTIAERLPTITISAGSAMNIRKLFHQRYAVAANPLRTERRLELTVLVLALLLSLQLLYSGARLVFGNDTGTLAPAADALRVVALHPSTAVGVQESAEVRGRPLFWDLRRPYDPAPEKVVSPEPVVEEVPKLKGVKLMGVFGSEDAAGIIALVKGKKQRILQGEKLEGWTLQSVEPNRVVLSDGVRQQELLLMQGAIVAAAPAPSTARPGTASKAPAAGGDSGADKMAIPPRMVPVEGRGVQRGG